MAPCRDVKDHFIFRIRTLHQEEGERHRDGVLRDFFDDFHHVVNLGDEFARDDDNAASSWRPHTQSAELHVGLCPSDQADLSHGEVTRVAEIVNSTQRQI